MQLPADREQLGERCILYCDHNGVLEAYIVAMSIFEGDVLVKSVIDIVAELVRESK